MKRNATECFSEPELEGVAFMVAWFGDRLGRLDEHDWSLALAKTVLDRLGDVDESQVVSLANVALHMPRRYAPVLRRPFLDVLAKRMTGLSRSDRRELERIADTVTHWDTVIHWQTRLPPDAMYARVSTSGCAAVRKDVMSLFEDKKELTMPITSLTRDDEAGSQITESDVRPADPDPPYRVCQ